MNTSLYAAATPEEVDLLDGLSEIDRGSILLIEPFLRELLAIFLSQEGLVAYKKIIIKAILDWAIHKWSTSISEIIAVEYQEHLLHNGISSNEATYKYFLELISKSDIREFIINKYPVFMDRLKHSANLFCSFISELLHRFQKDQALIAEKLFSSKNAGNTTSIVELTGIWVAGDTHNRGKSVAILTVCYQDQLFKAVYKPRDCFLDLALNEFYRFLNSSLTYSLKIPIIISQDNYFWSEYFKHAGCNEQSEIEEFYYRFGALTFVCYVLGGNDIHYENLIAYGKFPLILDCECFFYPYINWQDDESCPGTSMSTVLDSMILSSNTKDEKDISAFLGLKLLKEITQKQVCVTPSGEVKIEEFSVEVEKHIPKRNKPYLIKSDHQIDPLKYLEALISGFSDAYRAVLKNRTKLFEQKRFWGYIKNSKTRLVLRPTSIYLKLLKNMNHVSNLNDYTKYYEELGWLNNNRHFGNSSSSICFSECAQLLQGDVPTFYYDANLKKVVDGYGNHIQIKIVLDGEQNFLKLVGDNLSQDDLHAQVELIKQTAAVYEYNTDILYSNSIESTPSSDRKVFAKKGYLKIAGEILDCISKKRIIRDYDKINWIYPAEDFNKKLGLTWCDPTMYHGISGIGLSFLYGTLFFKNDNYKEIVTRCLLSLDAIIQRKEIFNNLGAFSGLGGILYFLDKTAIIIPELGASEIINRVLTSLDEKLDDLLKHELCVDIISGSSGLLAILAGLKCNHNKILHLTRRLMHHIIDRYTNPLNPVNAENASDRFMLGFSHGIAGMVFAMHRALKISPMPAALEWITRALRYERGYFDIEKGDWPNFIKEPGRTTNNIMPLGWCHGIMGIVMSRLEMYQQGWNDDVILFEIALLMKGMNSYQMPKTSNLCHGLMGVMDFLLQAQSYQYTSIAPNRFEQQVTTIMNNLGEKGKICTEFHQKLYTPGLMVGHAGVAYQCLRIADKTLVPSVLLLQ